MTTTVNLLVFFLLLSFIQGENVNQSNCKAENIFSKKVCFFSILSPRVVFPSISSWWKDAVYIVIFIAGGNGGHHGRFQVYGQSVISGDGTVEKSLAAVVRVPREQPKNEASANEMMPNDEPESGSSSGKIIFLICVAR